MIQQVAAKLIGVLLVLLLVAVVFLVSREAFTKSVNVFLTSARALVAVLVFAAVPLLVSGPPCEPGPFASECDSAASGWILPNKSAESFVQILALLTVPTIVGAVAALRVRRTERLATLSMAREALSGISRYAAALLVGSLYVVYLIGLIRWTAPLRGWAVLVAPLALFVGVVLGVVVFYGGRRVLSRRGKTRHR